MATIPTRRRTRSRATASVACVYGPLAFWPDEMRARYETYLRAVEAGAIDEALTRRGLTQPAPFEEHEPRPAA